MKMRFINTLFLVLCGLTAHTYGQSSCNPDPSSAAFVSANDNPAGSGPNHSGGVVTSTVTQPCNHPYTSIDQIAALNTSAYPIPSANLGQYVATPAQIS